MARVFHITSQHTNQAWLDHLRPSEHDPDDPSWAHAVGLLRQRLSERFILPINRIVPVDWSGHAVVALDCLLIDAIQSFKEGRPGGNRLQSKGNVDPRKSFVGFLTESAQLKPHFSKKDANSFYNNVRCGLLHNGETRGDWLIHKVGPLLHAERDSKKKRTLNCEEFHRAVAGELDLYLTVLVRPDATEQRRRFLRRMDAICQAEGEEADEAIPCESCGGTGACGTCSGTGMVRPAGLEAHAGDADR